MIQLKHNGFYWLEDKKYEKIYLGQYDEDWSGEGCFDLIGSDDIFRIYEFNVLEEVEIPDFIKKRLNEQD